METKVRLHRKMLKQAEFLKRQADKERREVLKEDESSNYEPTLPQNEPSPIPGPPPNEEESPDENDSASVSFFIFWRHYASKSEGIFSVEYIFLICKLHKKWII